MIDNFGVSVSELSQWDSRVDEFLIVHLRNAQQIAKAKGYIRTRLPHFTAKKNALEKGDREESTASKNQDEQKTSATFAQLNDVDKIKDKDPELLWLGRTRTSAGKDRWGHTQHVFASGRRGWKDPVPLSSQIIKLKKMRDWNQNINMGSVVTKWNEIVGDQVAAHAFVESFKDSILIVRTSSTEWAKQLQLLLPHIERRIDAVIAHGVVTQVIVRGPNAPSWKHGRYSVPGRGPRDTYG